jgi:hypothetical protein
MKTAITALLLSIAAAAAPEDAVRASICLNGEWDVILNAGGDQIPATGWAHRRAPAMPLAAEPAVVSAWYRRSVRIPREWVKPERRFLLQLEKVGHYAAVYANGKLIAEHYGQYDPVDADLTAALEPGKANAIAIYVHNASGKYARPGLVVTEPFIGNAYRGAADQEPARNWTGIVGDISLSWRPAVAIEDVFVVPSVRNKRLEARVAMPAEARGLTLRAAVLDGAAVVLKLPETSVKNETSLLGAEWTNPVLWGPEPYGQAKLYVLRTELLKQGKVIDRSFTRFGFREVWVSGRDVLLNGKKLWVAGTYFGKLTPLRYLNDRRPQSLMISIMQASGLNISHGHWDELGKTWEDLCDEMGMLVMAGFFCDGRPQIQSKADDGWETWMADTCRRWVRVNRNHPSVVMWRPTDVVPGNVHPRRPEFWARLDEVVNREDGTRPLVDDSDVNAWAQSTYKNPQDQSREFDDASKMAEALAASTKPLLTKEIYGGFNPVDKASEFFRTFYDKAYEGGGTGVIVQSLPVMQRSAPSRVEWLSESGEGNRDTGFPPRELANWCDPSQPAWNPSPFTTLFADLYRKHTGHTPAPSHSETRGEVLVSGLAPDDIAFLVPEAPDVAETIGVRASGDGKAWIIEPQPGRYSVQAPGKPAVRLAAHAPAARKPGYDYVDRVSVATK